MFSSKVIKSKPFHAFLSNHVKTYMQYPESMKPIPNKAYITHMAASRYFAEAWLLSSGGANEADCYFGRPYFKTQFKTVLFRKDSNLIVDKAASLIEQPTRSKAVVLKCRQSIFNTTNQSISDELQKAFDKEKTKCSRIWSSAVIQLLRVRLLTGHGAPSLIDLRRRYGEIINETHLAAVNEIGIFQ